MTDDAPAFPRKLEIERQLAQISSSKAFKNASRRVELLQYLVNMRLVDEEVDEDTIGYALIPDYVPDETDKVRVMASQLRKKLAEYYDGEGRDDPVRIDLPRGPSYQPTFSYSNQHLAARCYRRGLYRLRDVRLYASDLEGASKEFDGAITLAPKYVPAYVAKAQCLLLRTFYPPSGYPYYKTARSIADKALLVIDAALKLHPRSCEAYLIRGALYTVCRNWDLARADFDAALRLNVDETQRSFWYAAYELAVGNVTKAVSLIQRIEKTSPYDPLVQTICALFYYITRDFEHAYALLCDAASARLAATFLILRLVQLARRSRGGADIIAYSNGVHEVAPHAEYPGLQSLEGALNKELGITDISADVEYLHRKRSPQSGDWEHALSHMAIGDHKTAIWHIAESCSKGEAVAAWLHLWPFLDPLRDDEGFKALVVALNLPQVGNP